MQADTIWTRDAEMQFANGIDDTDFENLIAKSLQGKVCNRKGGQLATWSGAKTSTYVKHELLLRFLHRVSATCMALIRPHTEEPDDATVEHNAIRSQPSNPPLHEAGPWAKLCKSPKPEPVPCPERMLVCFTSRKCRSVTKLIFSRTHTSIFIALLQEPLRPNYFHPSKAAPLLDDKNSVQATIWDVRHPDTPVALLCEESVLTCACFAPSGTLCVVAGSATGLIILWDLSMVVTSRPDGHPEEPFMMGGVISNPQETVHESTILELCPMLSSCTSPIHDKCLTFQLLSVDDCGLLAIWLVADSPLNIEGVVAHTIDTMNATAPGRDPRLICLRSLTVWSSVPTTLGGSFGQSPARERTESHLKISKDNEFGPLPPCISAFATLPGRSDEYLVSLSENSYCPPPPPYRTVV